MIGNKIFTMFLNQFPVCSCINFFENIFFSFNRVFQISEEPVTAGSQIMSKEGKGVALLIVPDLNS